MDAVEKAELALESYRSENYGPLIGEEYEAEIARLSDELEKAYDEAGTPTDERIVL